MNAYERDKLRITANEWIARAQPAIESLRQERQELELRMLALADAETDARNMLRRARSAAGVGDYPAACEIARVAMQTVENAKGE